MSTKPRYASPDRVDPQAVRSGLHSILYFSLHGVEADLDSRSAHALEAHEKPGVLSKKRFDESVIPDAQRIPRATTASW